MHCHRDGTVPSGVAVRPKLEVADIARRFCGALCDGYRLSHEQQRVLRDIMLCRTAALGGHLDECPDCGHQRPSYNSCLNRHCPKCQWLASDRWVQQRQQRFVPTHHFHVVFTLPAELRALVSNNRKLLWGVLFHAATGALIELAHDHKRLSAQLGITAVLHSWTRDLLQHPHLHCLVSGGGLTADGRWIGTRPAFLFPAKVLGKLFRGKFLDALKRLYKEGELLLSGRCQQLRDRAAFQKLIDKLYRKKFRPYTKKPFKGVDSVCAYLGRYTHRTAISNRRLVSFDDDSVVFRTRGRKTVTVPPVIFLRRFLGHVLPKRFVRIRHYGLYAAGNVNTRLKRARALLEKPSETESSAADRDKTADTTDIDRDEPDFVRRIRLAFGIDISKCPRCGSRMYRHSLLPGNRHLSPSRSPPEVA